MFRSGNFLQYITRLVLIFTLMPIHEYAHAYVANKLGDPTAKNMGRLTLNPLAHIDPIGGLMLFLTGFGFAKAVPVNARNFNNPKRGMAIVAAAGPLSNILVSAITLALAKILNLVGYYTGLSYIGFYDFIIQFLNLITLINLSLAVFNLLPVPPLDGSKIFGIFLSDKNYFNLMQYERYIGIVLFALIYMGLFDKQILLLTYKLYDFIDMLTFFLPSLYF